MTLDELTHKLRAMRPMLDTYHVSRLRVFGSVARGDANPGSDVDLIADFSETPGLSFIGLQHDLRAAFGCDVDLMTENALHPMLKDRILQEARDVEF